MIKIKMRPLKTVKGILTRDRKKSGYSFENITLWPIGVQLEMDNLGEWGTPEQGCIIKEWSTKSFMELYPGAIPPRGEKREVEIQV